MNLLYLISLIFIAAIIPSSAEDAPKSGTSIRASILTPKNNPVSLETLKKLAPKAKITTDKKPKSISYKIDWGKTTLTINSSADYDQDIQNKGALGWISRFPEEDLNTKEVVNLQKFIPTVKQTYGLVLPNGFDSNGTVTSFLLKLTEEINGYIFCHSSFYDFYGFHIIGLPTDPPFFGRAGRNIILLNNPVSPKDLITGRWNVTTTTQESDEETQIHLLMTSEDEFLKDGKYQSEGGVEILITPTGSDEGFTVNFDFKIEGTWIEKAGQIIVTSTSAKTINPRCELPDLEEFLTEMTKGFCEETDPEASWLLTRDQNIILLEEAELGITSMMVRKEN